MRSHDKVQVQDMYLLLILVFSGICQVMLFLHVDAAAPERFLETDSASYLNTALALLETGRFAINTDNPDFPQVIRTPGYPFFIAALFTIFGTDEYAPIIITQIFLSLGTLLCTWYLARILWGSRVALISVLLLSCDLLSIISAQKILTETLFTCMVSVALIAGVRTAQAHSRHTGWFLLQGTLLSTAILVRPILYYFPFLLLVVWGIIGRIHFRWRWKTLFTRLVILMLPWCVFVGGWQARNYLKTGRAELSYIQGVNLFFYRGAAILAQRDGKPFETVREEFGYATYKTLQQHPDRTIREFTELYHQWKTEGIRIILHHPGFFVKIQIQGAVHILFETDWNQFLKHLTGVYTMKSGPGGDLLRLPLSLYIQRWIFGKPHYFALFSITAGYLLLLYVGTGISVFSRFRAKRMIRPGDFLIGLLVLYLIMLSAGPEANPRFRIPLMPFFAIYAGHGIALLLTSMKKWK